LTLPLHTSLCGAATTTWCSPPGTSMRSGTTPATYSCPSTPTCDPAGACTTSVDVAGAGTAGFGAGAGATAARAVTVGRGGGSCCSLRRAVTYPYRPAAITTAASPPPTAHGAHARS